MSDWHDEPPPDIAGQQLVLLVALTMVVALIIAITAILLHWG